MSAGRDYPRPLDLRHGLIDMTHGAGGRASAQLIEELFGRAFDNPWLAEGHDAARFAAERGRMVLTTDAHVVSPMFFPGGDIGSLAVHGTINDVAMAGARPMYLAASFVIQEGLPLATLERIVASMARASREARVPVIAGDTKVVEKDKGDGVFITTTGVGMVPEGVDVSGRNARAGDRVLLSGSIGDHGIAVMSCRQNLKLDSQIRSDSVALHDLVASMLQARPGIRVLRDPTRGGLGTTLNEIARQSAVGMMLQESAIPVDPAVRAACELLGLDPLYVANEGKLIAIVAADDAPAVLAAMRAHPLGAQAAQIGVVTEDPHHFVQMTTGFGGRRVVDWLSGEQLPRIC